MTLATKLPYSHPFSGGYPRLGGQALPTDPDAIDYLQRQAAVDGPVEVGVAMAVDQFVKGCKADGIWSAIKASCIMAGARTISGALVPLVGNAPTSYNFTGSDYNRLSGLQGDGSSAYLDSNRANDADGQDDQHLSVYVSASPTVAAGYIGVRTPGGAPTFSGTHIYGRISSQPAFARSRALNAYDHTVATTSTTGFYGASRADAAEYVFRAAGVSETATEASVTPLSVNTALFTRNTGAALLAYSDARLAFYSIGSAIPNLAALDNRVTNLVKGIQFWNYTGLSPHAYDPDTIAYVVAGYAAGGTL